MQLISLHPNDNVAVALCDQVAVRAIEQGEKVLKYGLPIGSATRDIEAGEHVHVQNMKSDYIWRPDR